MQQLGGNFRIYSGYKTVDCRSTFNVCCICLWAHHAFDRKQNKQSILLHNFTAFQDHGQGLLVLYAVLPCILNVSTFLKNFGIIVFTSEITAYVLRSICVLQEWFVREVCNLISLHGLCANKSDFYSSFMLCTTYQHFLLKIFWTKSDYVPKSTFISLGLERCFNAFEINILCSPSLLSFDQNYSKNCNSVKYY